MYSIFFIHYSTSNAVVIVKIYVLYNNVKQLYHVTYDASIHFHYIVIKQKYAIDRLHLQLKYRTRHDLFRSD